ncbi:hypothetical protein BH23CHL5_BH23CHL5_23000 [soil metagenome]
MTSCRHCGTTITATDTYCSSCGANVHAQSAPPPRITEADAKRIAKANREEADRPWGLALIFVITTAIWWVLIVGTTILAGITPGADLPWVVLVAAVVMGALTTIWINRRSEQTREQEPPVDWSGWRK